MTLVTSSSLCQVSSSGLVINSDVNVVDPFLHCNVSPTHPQPAAMANSSHPHSAFSPFLSKNLCNAHWFLNSKFCTPLNSRKPLSVTVLSAAAERTLDSGGTPAHRLLHTAPPRGPPGHRDGTQHMFAVCVTFEQRLLEAQQQSSSHFSYDTVEGICKHFYKKSSSSQ